MPYQTAINPKGLAGLHGKRTPSNDMKPYHWQTITPEFGQQRTYSTNKTARRAVSVDTLVND